MKKNKKVETKSGKRGKAKAGRKPTKQVEPAVTDEAPIEQHDPERCATPGCEGTPVMTLEDKPICQACWDRHCGESDNAGDHDTTSEIAATVDAVQTDNLADGKPKKKRIKAAGEPKRMSALDAAAEVLKQAGGAMHCLQMIEAMAERGLWSSPNGKTPAATLHAAIIREIATKGTNARFRKVERGKFEHLSLPY